MWRCPPVRRRNDPGPAPWHRRRAVSLSALAAVLAFGRHLTVTIVLFLLSIVSVLCAVTPAWADQHTGIRVGLLLMAIDARPDHVRISEALRVTNAGDPRRVSVEISLPPRAQYVTFHRGVVSPVQTEHGFGGTIPLRRGITEVAYSYAIPTGSREAIVRVLPFDVERMEVVGRGAQVRLADLAGRELTPVIVGGEVLSRWEIRGVRAGQPVVVELAGLPVTSRWWPPGAAGGLAVILALGLLKGVTSASQKS